ncbi:hypothetical protein GCM10027299_38270 [Larkinella ripae]
MIQQAIQYPALIKYLKGFSNYSWLYYCDGRKLLVAKSLCYFEERLPGFFRVHKTALVNPHYIMDFKAPPGHKMSGSIRLKDGETLPVSRRRWNQIIDPMLVMMMKSSAAFQPETAPEPGEAAPAFPTPVKKAVVPKSLPTRQLWVVMADETKGNLLRQLISEKWPKWQLQLFETGAGLQKALPGMADAEMPGMIILDGSETKSVTTLRSIKTSSRFRFIPTLLLTSAGNHDLTEQGYESGANSVIMHPADLTRFIQVLEKTFRYWLSMATAPYFLAKTNSSVR